jgi:hypothetical protein
VHRQPTRSPADLAQQIERRRRVSRPRPNPAQFHGAFLAGLLYLGLAGGVLLAYDAAHDGRILPGVHVGGVDLTGMDRQRAGLALAAAYSGLQEGQVTIHADGADVAVPYRAFSRRADVEAMVDEAMTAGRQGNALERAVAEVRTELQGLELTPRIALDQAALATATGEALARLELRPRDATLSIGAKSVLVSGSYPGRRFRGMAASAAVAA